MELRPPSRIFVHGTHFNWDLYGDGNPAPGTPITLWYAWSGIHQTWQFELGTLVSYVQNDLDLD